MEIYTVVFSPIPKSTKIKLLHYILGWLNIFETPDMVVDGNIRNIYLPDVFSRENYDRENPPDDDYIEETMGDLIGGMEDELDIPNDVRDNYPTRDLLHLADLVEYVYDHGGWNNLI